MKRTAAALALLAVATDVAPVRAELPKFEIPRLGIFRKKKEDPPPQPQPKKEDPAPKPARELSTVDVLKADLDEKNRVAAAEALRGVDPRTNPDVLPALTNSLQQDPAAAVRLAAAETIGKLKPVSAEAGSVLESVVTSDPSEPVRKAAQQALWQYHLNGYRSTAANATLPQTAEPPLAKPRTVTARPVSQAPKLVPPTAGVPAALTATPTARPITTGIGKGAIYPQTIEPPLAKPKSPVVTVKPEPPVVVPEKKPETVPDLPAIPLPMPMPSAGGVPVPPPSAVPTIPPPGN